MEEKEKEKEVPHPKESRSPSPEVKSLSVVKYSSVKCPVGYSQLRLDTDLKMPPSNWLSSATDSYGLRHAAGLSPGFSSFRMAHMFPDCVGEVDVVSGAECIKNLLKLPYRPDGTVSIVVHRIENTLLLDDFDIFHYLIKSEWSWMRTFFRDYFLKSASVRDRVTLARDKSRCALQRKNLVSKFLYHSLPSSKGEHAGDEDERRLRLPGLPPAGPVLPEPDVRKCLSGRAHNRNVVWTFENLQMLVGSDLPIFGGVDRPCVSLRLRDAGRPINVLTGIDYWLDNLMCNVPEVIMCYHLDGVVRRYEPVKTEDLPNLEDSKFSPKVIRNVAQNILSFLKSNATKAGHTYWLFKGADDDVVKLYDLTTLCGDDGDRSDRNPFTIPVATLLYRVARNMKAPCQAGQIKTLLENCIKLLPVDKYPHIVASSHFMLADLYVPGDVRPGSPGFGDSGSGACECGDPKTCRRQEGYDVPASDTGAATDRTGDTEIEQKKFVSGDVAVHSLAAPYDSSPGSPPPPPSVTGKPEDRCFSALDRIGDGLEALKLYVKEENSGSDRNCKDDDDKPNTAKPFEPIPMGYESLSGKEEHVEMARPNVPIPMPYKNSIEVEKNERTGKRRKKDGKNKKKSNQEDVEKLTKTLDGVILRKDDSLPTWQESPHSDDGSWTIRLKILLYEKALLSCALLAEQYFSECQYGLSYKYVDIARRCKRVLNCILSDQQSVPEYNLMERLGDNLYQFAKHWDKYRLEYIKQIDSYTETESRILKYIDSDTNHYAKNKNFMNQEFQLPTDQESAIVISGDIYAKALKISPKEKRGELLRRMASVKNELGLKYMYMAQEQYNSYCTSQEDEKQTSYKESSRKSLEYLTESAKMFEEVNDVPNIALLHCNIGRFMRFRAHCNLVTHSPEQRKLYKAAIDHYSCALRILADENCENVRDLVRWELSSALFMQACLMQDSPPNVTDPANEAIEALRLALRNCPLSEGSRQCLYQFRAGILHHRLASLYHNQFRDGTLDSAKLKAAAALSKINYEQAINLFAPLEDTTMFLTVQMEHVALTEYLANNSPGLKLKYFQEALDLLRQCEPMLKIIADKEPPEGSKSSQENNAEDKNQETPDDSRETEFKLLTLFEQRLQYVLKNLVQLCTQKSAVWKKENDNLLAFYKNAYSKTLKVSKFQSRDVKLLGAQLWDVLTQIKGLQCSSFIF